jgi:very-short-patch-repair endonuclease
VIVETYGDAYHSSKKQRQADWRRNNRLVRLGYTILIFGWDDVTKHRSDVIATLRSVLCPVVGV